MKNRNNYHNAEDFLSDESFQKWVRFNEDTMNWQIWTLENPERAKLVEIARLWILAMKVEETQISSQETQAALQETWERIYSTEQPKSIRDFMWFRVAASIIIGLVFANYFFKNQQTDIIYKSLVEQANNSPLIEQVNHSEKPQLIALSDGSSVLLQPKSKLSYPKIFEGSERSIFLSGEAFFEVSKNPERPFFVYASEVITRVYGTSFRVVAYENQPSVQVLVRTGKVRVSSNKAIVNKINEEIILLPNQAAKFIRKKALFDRVLAIGKDESFLVKPIAIEQLSFEFRDTPVYQIFNTIERAYLVIIDFPKEKLRNCYLTTSLSDEPLPEKLKIICESLGNGAKYEIKGNHVIITANECN